MLFSFIDESARDNAFYFLGAIVVNEQQHESLTIGLDQLLIDYEANHPPITRNVELHGSAIMRGVEFPWKSIPKSLSMKLFKNALQIIERTSPIMLIEGIRLQDLNQNHNEIILTPREVAFRNLLERMNICASNAESFVKVFADNHHTSQISISNFKKYIDYGTLGRSSSKLKNIHPKIEFINSNLSRGLQAVDLLTYLFNRVHTIEETKTKTSRAKAEMWEIVAALFDVQID